MHFIKNLSDYTNLVNLFLWIPDDDKLLIGDGFEGFLTGLV